MTDNIDHAAEARMCPCGSCKGRGKTWADAVDDLVHGPAKMNREQAEAHLGGML